jgi:putative hydrolase of the HAD superfamily
MAVANVIFLDAVGTLFGVKGSVGHAYAQIAAEFDVIIESQKLDYLFGKAFSNAPKIAFPDAARSQIVELERDWWRQIAIQVFSQAEVIAKFTDFDAFFERLYAYFATVDPWYVYEDTILALSNWKELGISLHIISNFDSRIYAVLNALELDSWFETVTISTLVGAAKPDRLIFESALEQLHIKPAQAFHIGDSYSEDYLGAIAVGINGIWLDRQNLAKNPPSRNIPTILKLSDFIPNNF